MPIETRYKRSDTHAINNLTAYQLKTTNTDASLEAFITSVEAGTLYIGIRVWKRNSAGDETEITGGSAVAVASIAVGVSGYFQINATWNCPQTSLGTTDAIVVRVYADVGVTPPTTLIREFITEQIGATQLDATTWTVYYWIRRIRITVPVTYYEFYYVHGSSSYNSRITNFSWSVVAAVISGDGLVWIQT